MSRAVMPALAVALLLLPVQLLALPGQLAPAAQIPASSEELPWFLTDMRPPDDPPPGFVMPSIHRHGGEAHHHDMPDYGTMNITPEQLEGPAGARTVYPLLHNLSMTVSFEHDATVAEFQAMDGGLRRFAALVYDYTDGQFNINRFDIYNNQQNWNSADVHVLNIPNYRANAQYGGYFYGGIIQVGRDAWSQSWDSPMGAVIYAHEFGHWGLCLPDEYLDPSMVTLCNNGAAGTCIMSDPYQYFEICTDESHDATRTGDPAGCWSYLKYYWPSVVEVHGSPDPGPTAAPGTTVVWHYPDITVNQAEMTTAPDSPNEGENITIGLSMGNPERLVTGTVNLRFYYDSQVPEKLISSQNLSFSSQGAVSASVKWRALGGTHSLIAVADPDNRVKEANEGNNTAIRSVTVNSKPRVLPSLVGFASTEDRPLTVKLTTYATDAEDPQPSLKWSVLQYDARRIVSVAGQNAPNQTLQFVPAANWFGTTQVTLQVVDTRNLGAQVKVNLSFSSVNDLPEAQDPSVSAPSVLRGRTVELSAGAADIEDPLEALAPWFEWRSPGGDWFPLNATFSEGRFRAAVEVPVTSGTGQADFRVSFTDTNGGQGEWLYLNQSLLVQNNRPSVADLSFSGESVLRGAFVTLTLNSSDAETAERDLSVLVERRLADGPWQALPAEEWQYFGGLWSFTLNVDGGWPTGLYEFRASVADGEGDRSPVLSVAQELLVQNNLPQIEWARVSRSRLLRNDSLTLSVAGGDAETPAGNLTLEIRVLDPKGREQGSYLGTSELRENRWEVSFKPPFAAVVGRYLFSVRLGDPDGGLTEWYSAIQQVEVLNNQPSAAFTGPDGATEGDSVWFDASNSSDAENHLTSMSYGWDFGDGTTGSGLRVPHTFKRAGSFRVVLTVTDRDGATATSERTVSVSARPPEPSVLGGAGGLGLLVTVVAVAAAGAGAGAYLHVRRKRKTAPPAAPSESLRVEAPGAGASPGSALQQPGETPGHQAPEYRSEPPPPLEVEPAPDQYDAPWQGPEDRVQDGPGTGPSFHDGPEPRR